MAMNTVKGGSKPKKQEMIVTSVDIKFAENGGVTLRVYQEPKNPKKESDRYMSMGSPKELVYSSWPEAESVVAEIASTRQMPEASAEPAAPATMGDVTGMDFDAAMEGEAPFRSVSR